MSVCLKLKLLTGLEKAFRTAKSLALFEGIQFVASGDEIQKRAKLPPITEQDIEAVLPRGIDAKDQILNSMIMKRLSNFLQDHTLQVSSFGKLLLSNCYSIGAVSRSSFPIYGMRTVTQRRVAKRRTRRETVPTS